MTDIPISDLIERLNDRAGVRIDNDPLGVLMRRAAEALSRLTVSPLPEETAGLIERLPNDAVYVESRIQPQTLADEIARRIEQAAAALQQQAREIERLQEVQKSCHRDIIRQDARIAELESRLNDFTDPNTPGMVSVGLANIERDVADDLRSRNDKLRVRITELEAERDRLRDLVECKDCMEYAHRVADAIRAKTIKNAIEAVEWFRNVSGWNCDDVIDRIRALNQPETGGGE